MKKMGYGSRGCSRRMMRERKKRNMKSVDEDDL